MTRHQVSPVELARALAMTQGMEEERRRADVPVDELPERRVDLFVFRIAGHRFGVDLVSVEEAVDHPVIHFVPEMVPAMAGVTKVRGEIIPVYSPSAALDLPLAPRNAALIFRTSRSKAGILVDDVEDAISMDMNRPDPSIAVIDVPVLIAACRAAAPQETP